MVSLQTPPTQAPPATRSWRSKMSVAMVAEILKKGPARPGSPSNSQNSADTRNLSTATTTFDQERATQEKKIPGENCTPFDGSGPTDAQAALPPHAPTPTSALAPALETHNPMAGTGDVEYTNLTWWQCGMCMVAETISLGILSLPRALGDLGLVAGLIILIFMGALASYSGYIIGRFKLRYPEIHNMGHAGTKLFGTWGGHIIGVTTLAFIVFIMGAHILTFKMMMNILTENAFCGVMWSAVGFAISFVACLPRTIKKMSYMSAASFVSIIGAVLVCVVVIIKDHPGIHTVEGHKYHDISAWPKPGLAFHDYFTGVTSIVFAYAGHVAFFSFISELRDPREFNKSLAFLQVIDITMYVISALLIYVFGGDNVESPALNSLGPKASKIAWAIASITIIIAGVVNGHIAIKTAYVAVNKRMGGEMMLQRTVQSVGIWIGITAALWVIAFLLAELIPIFMPFVGLTGALFGSWFTYGCPAMFWMYMNLESREEWVWPFEKCIGWNGRKWVAWVVNHVLLLVALVVFVAGTYSSIRSIIDAAKKGNTPFSCHQR